MITIEVEKDYFDKLKNGEVDTLLVEDNKEWITKLKDGYIAEGVEPTPTEWNGKTRGIPLNKDCFQYIVFKLKGSKEKTIGADSVTVSVDKIVNMVDSRYITLSCNPFEIDPCKPVFIIRFTVVGNYTVIDIQGNELEDFDTLEKARETVEKWLDEDEITDTEFGQEPYEYAWGYGIRRNADEGYEEYPYDKRGYRRGCID